MKTFLVRPAPKQYTAWDGSVRQWVYQDNERPKGCCYDCKRPYAAVGDCAVPEHIWERINPTRHFSCGLLCANCIIERMGVLGIGGVQAVLYPGRILPAKVELDNDRV